MNPHNPLIDKIAKENIDKSPNKPFIAIDNKNNSIIEENSNEKQMQTSQFNDNIVYALCMQIDNWDVTSNNWTTCQLSENSVIE